MPLEQLQTFDAAALAGRPHRGGETVRAVARTFVLEVTFSPAGASGGTGRCLSQRWVRGRIHSRRLRRPGQRTARPRKPRRRRCPCRHGWLRTGCWPRPGDSDREIQQVLAPRWHVVRGAGRGSGRTWRAPGATVIRGPPRSVALGQRSSARRGSGPARSRRGARGRTRLWPRERGCQRLTQQQCDVIRLDSLVISRPLDRGTGKAGTSA